MTSIFFLSGDYIDLAKEEILSLFDARKHSLVDKLVIVDLKHKNIKTIKIQK